MHWGLILPPTGRSAPSEDIAVARRAAELGASVVWVGERDSTDGPARLSALAAATPVGLGLGAVPLTGEIAGRLEDTVTTLRLLADGRVSVVLDLPTTLSAPTRPAWHRMLEDLTPAIRRAGVRVGAVVPDAATARLAASTVDHLVLRAADAETAGAVVDAVRLTEPDTEVEVWLDIATGDGAHERLAAVTAERIAVPGVPGHGAAVRLARSRGLAGLHGDLESRYAAGAVDQAARVVPPEFVAATTLTDADLADRVAAYDRAGVAGLCLLPHPNSHQDRLACVEAFAAAC